LIAGGDIENQPLDKQHEKKVAALHIINLKYVLDIIRE
jgi:hypothetical protein